MRCKLVYSKNQRSTERRQEGKKEKQLHICVFGTGFRYNLPWKPARCMHLALQLLCIMPDIICCHPYTEPREGAAANCTCPWKSLMSLEREGKKQGKCDRRDIKPSTEFLCSHAKINGICRLPHQDGKVLEVSYTTFVGAYLNKFKENGITRCSLHCTKLLKDVLTRGLRKVHENVIWKKKKLLCYR